MTTTLNCYNWMLNQHGQLPFAMAQEVGQLCNPEYTVSQTDFQEGEYTPNATTSNGCTCSWAIYNLLSACSYCVGQYQYTSWNTWTINCGSSVSNTSYLPSGYNISQGIPYWAAQNPSGWENGVFDITQASNIASENPEDVTGEPLPTATTTASSTSSASSSTSSVSVGAIVGGVIGGIAIVIIGGLFIFWVVRRHRRQRTHTAAAGIPSSDASVPSIRNREPVQPTTFGYPYSSPAPVTPYLKSLHSTTSLDPTSLTSPVSSGFSSNEHSAALPLTDAADMISPFLAMSPGRKTNRSNTPPLTSKVAEALSERVMAPPGQRARLNPPPYSPSTEPGSPGTGNTWPRRLSMKEQKRREGSVSGATSYSGHSRTSTRESAAIVRTGTQMEQSRPRAADPGTTTARSLESAASAGGVGSVDGGGSVQMAHGGRAAVSDQDPPAV